MALIGLNCSIDVLMMYHRYNFAYIVVTMVLHDVIVHQAVRFSPSLSTRPLCRSCPGLVLRASFLVRTLTAVSSVGIMFAN